MPQRLPMRSDETVPDVDPEATGSLSLGDLPFVLDQRERFSNAMDSLRLRAEELQKMETLEAT
jgi:hypothetical protein